MPAANHLVYRLDGDVHEIDVFKLAPTLLALGALIQESNHILFPDGYDIGVNVKPFREGSFIVDLNLFSASHLQQIVSMFAPHSAEQLKSLLECIGLVGTGIGTMTMGAVHAIKFLRGKPKSVAEVAPNEFRYTAGDDRSVTVNGNVHALLSNPSITLNLFKIYGPPMMDQPFVDGVKTYLEGEEDDAVVVRRDEVPIIREFIESPAETTRREINKEIMHPGVFLNPKRGAFGDDPKDWSFWRGNEEIITATIRDKEFLAKVRTGEIRLNQNDLLTVDLLERQKVIGTRVQKPTYEVMKVTDYKRGEEDLGTRDITFGE